MIGSIGKIYTHVRLYPCNPLSRHLPLACLKGKHIENSIWYLQTWHVYHIQKVKEMAMTYQGGYERLPLVLATKKIIHTKTK